jgi:hypothetical protein
MPTPIDPAALPSAALAKAAEDMARVLASEPQLGIFGFGVPDERRKSPAERDLDLEAGREALQVPKSLAAFVATRVWLRQFHKIKTLNKSHTRTMGRDAQASRPSMH